MKGEATKTAKNKIIEVEEVVDEVLEEAIK